MSGTRRRLGRAPRPQPVTPVAGMAGRSFPESPNTASGPYPGHSNARRNPESRRALSCLRRGWAGQNAGHPNGYRREILRSGLARINGQAPGLHTLGPRAAEPPPAAGVSLSSGVAVWTVEDGPRNWSTRSWIPERQRPLPPACSGRLRCGRSVRSGMQAGRTAGTGPASPEIRRGQEGSGPAGPLRSSLPAWPAW
jgi:hypothetical protein